MKGKEWLTKCIINKIIICECGAETYINIGCENYSFVVQDPHSPHDLPYSEGMTVYGILVGFCEIKRSKEKTKKIIYSKKDDQIHLKESIGQVVEVIQEGEINGNTAIVDVGNIYIYAIDRMKNKAKLGEYVIVPAISQCAIRSIITKNPEYCEKIEINKYIREPNAQYLYINILKGPKQLKINNPNQFSQEPGKQILVKITYQPWAYWKLSDKNEKIATPLPTEPQKYDRYRMTGKIIRLTANPEKNILEVVLDCGFYVHTQLCKTIRPDPRTIKVGDPVSYEHPDYKKIKTGDYISYEEGTFEAWNIVDN